MITSGSRDLQAYISGTFLRKIQIYKVQNNNKICLQINNNYKNNDDNIHLSLFAASGLAFASNNNVMHCKHCSVVPLVESQTAINGVYPSGKYPNIFLKNPTN